jgi:hypothetical protein
MALAHSVVRWSVFPLKLNRDAVPRNFNQQIAHLKSIRF